MCKPDPWASARNLNPPPLHFSDIIYRYNLWRSMIKIVHPRRLGLRIAENRRLCSFPVCCGSNLRIKKILIIARNESLLHTMYIISNRSEEIDEELVRKLSVWKKTKFKSETPFRIYRTERKNEYRETDILLRICDVVNGNVKLESPWTGWDFVCCSKHGRQSYR